MTKMYLLDTDTISYRIRGGNPALSERMRHTPNSSMYVSTVSEAELLFGIKRFPQGHPRRTDVELFLAAANLLEWPSSAAEAYADIRNTLTLSGQLIGELDMMIAAHALALDATLVTNNTRHYSRIVPPLRLENWAEA